MDEKERLFIRGLCKQSFWHFINFCVVPFRIPPSKRMPLKEEIHKVYCDFLQNDTYKRKGNLMPRGFGKTTYGTESKPIWDYVRNQEERILIGAEVYERAKQFVSTIKRDIEENPYLHYFFPETKLPDGWGRNHRWSSEALDMPRKGSYREPSFYPIGVGGASQGMHFTRAYLDDIIGMSSLESIVERMKTERWFNNVEELLEQQDYTHPNASFITMIGTHWAVGDLYQSIQNEKPIYEWLKIKAMDRHGNPTWPEKLSAKKIADMVADPKQVMVFYTQYQNDPMETELTDFKNDWLKYYSMVINKDGLPCVQYTVKVTRDGEFTDELRTIPVAELEIRATIDPAVSESGTKKTARTAIVIVGVDKHNKKHVLEAWARKTNKNDDLYDKVFEFHQKYRPRQWGIETYAQQNFILRAIRDKAEERRVFLPIVELAKDVGMNSKDIRIRSLQDDFVSGDIFIHKTMTDFVSEYLSFPMGVTKDLMDALAYHKQWWTKAKVEEIVDDQEWRFQQYLNSRAAAW